MAAEFKLFRDPAEPPVEPWALRNPDFKKAVNAAAVYAFHGGLDESGFIEAARAEWQAATRRIYASACPGCGCAHHRCACE